MPMIITKDSHVDHQLTVGQLEWVKSQFQDYEEFFTGTTFVRTVELSKELGTVEVSLVGPMTTGGPVDERDVCYRIRGDRKYASRMLKPVLKFYGGTVESFSNKPLSRLVTVVAGPHNGEPCVLYTAYGGPQAPREPGDPAIPSWEELVASREFWSQHALVL